MAVPPHPSTSPPTIAPVVAPLAVFVDPQEDNIYIKRADESKTVTKLNTKCFMVEVKLVVIMICEFKVEILFQIA